MARYNSTGASVAATSQKEWGRGAEGFFLMAVSSENLIKTREQNKA